MRTRRSRRYGSLPLVLVLLILCAACGVPAPAPETVQEEVSAAVHIPAEGGAVIADLDDHGGLHNDGLRYAALEFSSDSCLCAIQSNTAWQPLPLTSALTALVYGAPTAGPYLTTGSPPAPVFPVIEEGYYYFWDRHRESTDPQDSTQVLARASFNLTIAIYDSSTDTLHYCVFDT